MTKTYLKYRTRILILAGFIFFSWISLCIRLFQVQVLHGNHYQNTVIKQSQKKQILPATRGNIYDRNNRPLTRNLIHYTLSANPSKVVDKNGLANAISKRTGISSETYLKKLNSSSKFEYLERNLQRETLGSLEIKNFEGLNIERKYRRYYPHNQIAAQVLGYTNLDDIGISGIEKDFNEYLKGESGWVYKTKGWSGQVQHKSGMPFKKPIHGGNIQLTIDLEYQSILEEELLKRQMETKAISATGIIMDPETGEILAIASTPGFDNNRYYSTSPELHRIRSITDQFEPGSTYKIIPAISAIYNGEISLTEEFNCENGAFEYYNIKIADHKDYGLLTLPQIVHYSSNIGIIKIVEKLGSKAFYETSRNMGFGSKTGISIRGEIAGKLSPYKNWSAVSAGQIAMGHEVGVTAIQLASAYCAIANGGYLLKPRIVKQIINQKNKTIYFEEPVVVRKIADFETMAKIRNMLRGVVTTGTGANADIAGWKIAGKTGTAQKWIEGKYSNKKFISNFIGFFPFEAPQLLAFIMLDEPIQPYHWGAEGAAVAYSRIIKRIINMDDKILPPTKEQNLTKHIDNYTNPLTLQNAIDNEKNNMPLTLSTVSKYANKTKVPEIKGYSMRKAISLLSESGLKFKINGSGKVSYQSLEAGDIVDKGTVCIIGLK